MTNKLGTFTLPSRVWKEASRKFRCFVVARVGGREGGLDGVLRGLTCVVLMGGIQWA